MPLKLIFLASVLRSLVQSDKIDVMKVANVPFPNAGCCKPHHWSASASATLERDIPAFTVCYRMLIDSYNEGFFYPFGADSNGEGLIFHVLDRMC